jgi:hypothetical protein
MQGSGGEKTDMSNRIQKTIRSGARGVLVTMVLGLSAVLVGSCGGEPGADDGEIINAIILPTDTLLNLACADVGIVTDNCVLGDPENPFVTVPIIEFNVNDPASANKFQLFNGIPRGRNGAKARFYFWATALARRASGENQFYTALALHELWNFNSDPIIRTQALKAYRSVLDNFFGSVTVFTCCPAASPTGQPIPFAVGLNELTADNLYRTDATGYARLVPGDPLLVQSLLLDWGFTYRPAKPPNFDDGLVFVNGR